MLKETDLNNLKIILRIQSAKLSPKEIDFYLDKILAIQTEIKKLKNKNAE